MVTLTRSGSTLIYTAPAEESLVYLLYSSAAPPATLSLEETWTNTGYYLFLTTPPVDAAALERSVRAAIAAPPQATGFLWAFNDAPSFDVAAILNVAFNAKNQRVVAADTNIPSGIPPLGIGGGKVIAPSKDYSTISVSGITIALTGPLARTLTFSGLFTLGAMPDGDSAVKNIVSVEVDPLGDSEGSATVGGFGPTLVLSSGPKGYAIGDIEW